ncbi:MAG: efflux RND transporter periplasmic adaptor subunit [Ignavibacteria bacterium]|nr:efflux RND transporter periplasmic adaptor subunit [Ignavibacteria bacterium]
MSKTVRIILIALLLLIVLGLIIVPKIITNSDKPGANQRQNTNQQNQITSVDGFVLKSEVLNNEIKAIGNIRANEEAEIRSEISRKIRGIYFKEGTYVSKGRTLFKLDSDDLTAKLRRQEIDERLAISKLEREKQLIDKGLTSREDYEVMESTLEQIRAEIQITRIDISKTYVRAPFSGIIGLRNVSNGSYVTPQTVMTTMQDMSKVKIDFSIPEKYVYLFKKGQKLKFKVEGIDGEFDAEVYASEPKIENNTRSLVLRAVADNPSKKLLPGTFANVSFTLSEIDNAIMIPTQALVPKLKGQSIFVVRNGKAKSIDVEIGERSETLIQIISDELKTGDTIITTNILRIKDNSSVKVEKAD